MAQTRALSTATATGNFEAPGMNLAGRLSYRTPEAALAGTQSILALQQRIQSFAWLTSLMGMGNPIQQLQLTPSANNVDFRLSLQGGVVSQLIEQLAAAVGAPPARVQATSGG
jgi:hypothetical protein